MDSINSFKGYGKVNEIEDREFRRKARKRLILIGVSAILLLVIIAVATIGLLANKHGGDSGDNPSSPASSAGSIKAMCSVTRYPNSCYSSISSAKGANVTTDPEELFKIALGVAIDAVMNISSLPDTLAIQTKDATLQAALQDCKELFAAAVDNLNASLVSMLPSTADEKVLTASKIADLKTWLSAAITDQATCLDGFENTTGGFREKLEAAMVSSSQLTSNSLAIVTGILGILEKLNIPIHRKLLGSTDMAVPSWISSSQRRSLLQDSNGSRTPDVVVAADGSGKFKTIGEALALVPKKNEKTFLIYVKEGEYKENVVVDKKMWNVMMVGDGMSKTIVTASKNRVDGTPTFSTGTFIVTGKNFIAKDMGFRNSAGPEKHQAVALRSGADRSIFYRCSFDAYQDTLYVHSLRQFYRDCDITGTVDFIFGDASVVFQNCTIRPRESLPNQQNTITAQGRTDPNENTGISIHECTISPFDNVTVPTYLGRPWKDYSTTVIMRSNIDVIVDSEGWLAWIPGTEPPSTIFYAEYQNTGPGSNLTDRVPWAGYRPILTSSEASKYTVDSFIQGSEWISEAGVSFTSSL